MPTESPSRTLHLEAGPRSSRLAARRLREQARDAATAAGLSLAGSIVVVVAIWAVTTWLT